MGGYWVGYDKATVIQNMRTLCTNYNEEHQTKAPAQAVPIGTSYRGRTIWAFKVGNPAGGKILLAACLHGWEDAGSVFMLDYLGWLLTSGDPAADDILDKNYTILVPYVNVDTLEHGNGNTSGSATSCPTYGVDLNRNFPTGFNPSRAICGITSGTPEQGNDWGSSAGTQASEPETQAMRALFLAEMPRYFIDLHYGGNSYIEKHLLNDETLWTNILQPRATAIYNELTSINEFPYQITYPDAGWAGGGFEYADCQSLTGAQSFLIETGCPSVTDRPGYTCYAHTYQDYQTVHDTIFPKLYAIVRAFSEECAGTLVTHTLTISPTTYGYTNPSASAQPYVYDEYATAVVTATPATNYVFHHWTLDGLNAGATNPISIPMSADHVLTPVFVLRQFMLSILPAEHGHVIGFTPDNYLYDVGTQLTLTAVPESDQYLFVRWIIDGQYIQTLNPVTFALMGDRTFQPVFRALNKYTVSILTIPSQVPFSLPPGTTPFTVEMDENITLVVTAPDEVEIP